MILILTVQNLLCLYMCYYNCFLFGCIILAYLTIATRHTCTELRLLIVLTSCRTSHLSALLPQLSLSFTSNFKLINFAQDILPIRIMLLLLVQPCALLGIVLRDLRPIRTITVSHKVNVAKDQ